MWLAINLNEQKWIKETLKEIYFVFQQILYKCSSLQQSLPHIIVIVEANQFVGWEILRQEIRKIWGLMTATENECEMNDWDALKFQTAKHIAPFSLIQREKSQNWPWKTWSQNFSLYPIQISNATRNLWIKFWLFFSSFSFLLLIKTYVFHSWSEKSADDMILEIIALQCYLFVFSFRWLQF